MKLVLFTTFCQWLYSDSLPNLYCIFPENISVLTPSSIYSSESIPERQMPTATAKGHLFFPLKLQPHLYTKGNRPSTSQCVCVTMPSSESCPDTEQKFSRFGWIAIQPIHYSALQLFGNITMLCFFVFSRYYLSPKCLSMSIVCAF